MREKIIDGRKISEEIRAQLRDKIIELKEKGIVPGLATILVGDDPASKLYVGMKQKACQKIGVYSEQHTMSSETPETELLDLIENLNKNPRIHGILIQLPLPGSINTNKVLLAIDPSKDVDGFHPVNIGRLNSKKSMREIEEEGIFLPCTPHGIMQLLKRTGVKLEGSEAVVVGRSNIVGKPVSMLLMAENATVTICHSRTKDLGEITQRADILIAAIGRPRIITEEMVKEGAVVIDVGQNSTADGLCGDVDFDNVKKKAKAITPVPGGVGPMTITMLLSNTVSAAEMPVSEDRT
ncbi:MAG: bifunctional methylenetetrahydrofolate dehydrogenase/methenyltetrahydrofolate cyclohydrolase FolD [Elusimicrobiota bacterium]